MKIDIDFAAMFKPLREQMGILDEPQPKAAPWSKVDVSSPNPCKRCGIITSTKCRLCSPCAKVVYGKAK